MFNFREIFYIPNILTISRILLTPIFLISLFWGNFYLFISFVIFSIAAFTDFLDGYFARKKNIVTKYGAFIDPLADKILIMSAFFAFWFMGIVRLWIVLLILFRDLGVTGLRMWMIKNGESMKTSFFAKSKTVFQFIAIYLILGYLILNFLFGNPELIYYSKLIIDFLMYIVALITLLSGLDYLIKNKIFLIYEIFATFCGIGYAPFCPGSIASFLTMLILYFSPEFSLFYNFSIVVGLFILGVYSSGIVASFYKKHDPSFVVIDEVLGMFVSLLFVPKTMGFYTVAFGAFRFFDILKVYPINKIEKLKGGYGIMLDDLLAGIFAFFIVHFIKFWLIKP